MLDELRTIYEERNTLNQITMSIMLPRPTQHCNEEQKVYHGTTAVKMQCVERWGGGCMLSQSAELVAALDRLKANLSLERKMLLQMMELLLKKVRRSIRFRQHGVFVCKACCEQHVSTSAWRNAADSSAG